MQTVLATLPGSAPCQRLQVALEQGEDGRLTICLADQHHAEGIGWFTQRSMQLDPTQWAQLQGVLGSAGARSLLAEESSEPPATIPFPGPRGPERYRLAAGDGSE
ncbi:hypothetical protein [Tautonia plasticadhaerens]|uniref:Uncharacterized protein n=1 Tax=Tautonia plasticadhaerens TaxID=2527974 RepID=A0A518GXK3_9BACT|nr:hypothetical protein [Tautonia plasticadhaerens]QDV33320.1 hypothetical protein ElP_11910 [Tautonia plasticadhaerens]